MTDCTPFELSNRHNMTATTRKRKKQNYIPLVLEAVKALSEGQGRGVSRQNIVKYLEGKLNDGTNSVNNLSSSDEAAIKSTILTALNSGLLVQASGVGLNGSYVLNSDRNIQCDKQKAIITNQFHESTSNQSRPSKVENSPKRHRVTKRDLPNGDLLETVNQFETSEKITAFKTILKPPIKIKKASKMKRNSGSRRVKFRSPAKVIFISPSIKRRSQRRKKSESWS